MLFCKEVRRSKREVREERMENGLPTTRLNNGSRVMGGIGIERGQ